MSTAVLPVVTVVIALMECFAGVSIQTIADQFLNESLPILCKARYGPGAERRRLMHAHFAERLAHGVGSAVIVILALG